MSVVRSNNKKPDNFKYVAYLRVEVQNIIKYYHFYDRVTRIEVKKPHIAVFENDFEQPLIKRFIKNVSDETRLMIEQKMNKLIECLSETFGVEFQIVDDEW